MIVEEIMVTHKTVTITAEGKNRFHISNPNKLDNAFLGGVLHHLSYLIKKNKNHKDGGISGMWTDSIN